MAIKPVSVKYWDIVIVNKKSYFICETPIKPTVPNSALETLKKIDFVLQHQLSYIKMKDKFSILSERERFSTLMKKANTIYDGYIARLDLLKWLRRLFVREAPVHSLIKKIRMYQPPAPKVVFKKINQFLGGIDIASLMLTSKKPRDSMLERARECGYVGMDTAAASKYVESLFKEIRDFCKPNEPDETDKSMEGFYHYKTDGEVDPERTLGSIKKLSIPDLFKLLANEKLYSFIKLRKIFNLKGPWKISKDLDSETQKNADKALISALETGDAHLVEFLLAHGANPNRRSISDKPALHLAVERRSAKITELLLQHGADPNTAGPDSQTALMVACVSKTPNMQIIEILLKHRAEPNLADRNGNQALHVAAKAGSAPVVKLLLDNHAYVNGIPRAMYTPLLYACGAGLPNAEVVRLLLENGADPSLAARNGNLPLHLAARSGQVEITKLLLKQDKVDVNALDDRSATALITACSQASPDQTSHAKIVDLLLTAGADPNRIAASGNSALRLAAQRGSVPIVTMLLAVKAS